MAEEFDPTQMLLQQQARRVSAYLTIMDTVAKLLDMYAEGEVSVSRVELKQMADMLREGVKDGN